MAAREGEQTLRTEDLEALIDRRGSEIALVLLGGVHYYTGQAFDLARIAESVQDTRSRPPDTARAGHAGQLPARLDGWRGHRHWIGGWRGWIRSAPRFWLRRGGGR